MCADIMSKNRRGQFKNARVLTTIDRIHSFFHQSGDMSPDVGRHGGAEQTEHAACPAGLPTQESASVASSFKTWPL